MSERPMQPERIELSRNLALAILKSLGVDSRQVVGITLDMQAGEPAILTIKRCIPAGPMEGLTQLLERSELAPKLDPEAFGLPIPQA